MRPMGDRPAADRIRNVALVGHRGAGKTSLHEALLFEAGVTSRLGSVPDGSTISDADPDEQARQMSISATLRRKPAVTVRASVRSSASTA